MFNIDEPCLLLMPEEEQNLPFKIVALIPRDGCKPEYLKVLNIEQPYYFYQTCTIGGHEELVEKPYLHNLFNEKKPHIEITAIVGKNGSGKSTIMELLFMALNNLTFKQEKIRRDLVYVNGVHVDLYFLSDRFYKIKVDHLAVTVFAFNVDKMQMIEVANFDFKQLFYTVAVNYSHYAYNDRDYPKGQAWLRGVFHKNDAYQIPIVLNPYRNNGNININGENELVNSRIIANLLRPSTDKDFNFRNLSEKFRAVRLKLKLDNSKKTKVLYERTVKEETPYTTRQADGTLLEKITIDALIKIDRPGLLKTINEHYPFGHQFEAEKRDPEAITYIFYKLVNIALKYDDYKKFFSKTNDNFRNPDRYIKKLLADPSHIGFKLKQTLNYLHYRYIRPEQTSLDLDEYGGKIYKRYETRGKHIKELIELIPPPIFRPEIIMREIKGRKVSSFKYLSSGEKQMNYTVSSLLYHLNNLDSIPSEDEEIGDEKDKDERISYQNVFAVMEEIELYFHPEMQRKYVDHVVKSIVQLQLKRIKNIHICFVTHSPFILSDLPQTNILFLDKNGKPTEEDAVVTTFGGNIHELLAKSFFLEEALIGEFAKGKIKWLIDQVKQPEKADLNVKPVDIDHELVMGMINAIGEEFIREKLREMYYERFDIEADEKIAQLRAQIKQIEDDKIRNQQKN